MMGDRRCCCNQDCIFFGDDFDRVDSTDLGSGWHEVSGDWYIFGYALYEPGPDPAIVMCTTKLPQRSKGEMSITVDVYNHADGDVYIIYPACIDLDNVGSVRVEFTRVATNTWKTEIIGSSCDDTFVLQAPAYNEIGGLRLSVCVDADVTQMRAGVAAQPGYPDLWCDNADAGPGQYCGLGHANTTGATFDDFYMTELRKSQEPRPKLQECTNCWCWCLDNPPRKHLSARFRDIAVHYPDNPGPWTRSSCLTQVWDMDWEYSGGTYHWFGEVTVPATSDGGLATDFAFYLTCSQSNDDDYSWPGRNFELIFRDSTCTNLNSNGTGPYQPIADESTCTPFSLVFGPFHLRCDDLSCYACWPPTYPRINPFMPTCDSSAGAYYGTYYIVITEA